MNKRTELKIRKLIRESIRKQLNESMDINNLTPEEQAFAIENMIKKQFPKSYVRVKRSKGLGESIYGVFTLGKDKSEWANGIYNNDPLLHTFHIWLDETPTQLEWSQGNMRIAPEKKHMAYGSVKTGMRGGKGDMNKIMKALTTFFTKKLPTVVKKSKDKIHPEHLELFKKKGLI